MLKNRLIYLTVSTCTPLIIMRTLQRKLIVKINSMKGKNLSIMAMLQQCSVLADSNLHKNAVPVP